MIGGSAKPTSCGGQERLCGLVAPYKQMRKGHAQQATGLEKHSTGVCAAGRRGESEGGRRGDMERVGRRGRRGLVGTRGDVRSGQGGRSSRPGEMSVDRHETGGGRGGGEGGSASLERGGGEEAGEREGERRFSRACVTSACVLVEEEGGEGAAGRRDVVCGEEVSIRDRASPCPFLSSRAPDVGVHPACRVRVCSV